MCVFKSNATQKSGLHKIVGPGLFLEAESRLLFDLDFVDFMREDLELVFSGRQATARALIMGPEKDTDAGQEYLMQVQKPMPMGVPLSLLG